MKNEKTGKKLIICFDDKAKGKAPITLEDPTESYLQELNEKGFGIFQTANSFFATPEQLKDLAIKKNKSSVTKRNKKFLSHLNEVFGDLDICKDDDDLSQEERDKLKTQLKDAINNYCPASTYVITKNGLQPRWWIEESSIDESTQQKYINVTNGIIEWSKQNGAKGDPVKDVTRVLRKPFYYHHKSEPYLVTEESGNGKTYTLDELKEYFWYEPTTNMQKSVNKENESIYNQIASMDIRHIVIDVWKEKGSEAKFDEAGHLIIDGVATATFLGSNGNYIATSSSDFPAKGNAVTYVAETFGITTKEAFKWILKKYNIHNNNTTGEGDKLKSIFADNSARGSLMISRYLVDKYHTKTIGERVRDIYIYKDGVYILGVNTLKEEIQKILQEFASTHAKNNIIEMVKDSSLISREDFHVDKNFINLNNGVFSIKDGELRPHNPEYLFFTKIPVNYDPKATCPLVEKFLSEILPEYYVKVIIEWFGYCLYRQYFIKKAMICVGERDTGKTTLVKLCEKFIGRDNTSGISLQKMVSDKFSSSHLYNKHINLYDDLSFKDINDNGAFKIATGGGIITGEKKFGDQFQFQNFSKLTFACNKIPDVKDSSDDAYFSRWIVIPFLAEIKKVNKFLTEEITTEGELSGLLNLAILGLNEILQKQNFSYDKSPEDIKKEMLLSGSMVANFVENCLEEELGAWVSKDEMYEECTRYTQSKKLPTIDKQVLGRKLPNHSGYIIDGTKLIGNKQVRGWRNVRIKGKEESGNEGYEGDF